MWSLASRSSRSLAPDSSSGCCTALLCPAALRSRTPQTSYCPSRSPAQVRWPRIPRCVHVAAPCSCTAQLHERQVSPVAAFDCCAEHAIVWENSHWSCWCLPCQHNVPLRAGLLWFNREGSGIWDLSVADAWPQPHLAAGDLERPRLPSTLGLATTRPHTGGRDWLLRAGAFVLPRQPSAEEGGYSGHFHGNDLRSYAWSDAATLPDPLTGADFS